MVFGEKAGTDRSLSRVPFSTREQTDQLDMSLSH